MENEKKWYCDKCEKYILEDEVDYVVGFGHCSICGTLLDIHNEVLE